ncbi:MAG: alpha/beta hydrolase, partial [Actinomycetota bacterium]|nr:alpha/beta hydrolase [Actinomycetota bacterium]
MSSFSAPLSTPEDQDGAKETPKIRYLSRREMLGLMGSTAIAVTLAGCGGEQSGSSSSPSAPNLPEGFTDTFTSRYIDTSELRLHAVIGGEGPPLLLVHGWPETWYAWRMLMPTLARDFEVIAVDQRGMGLSDKPQDGYDTGTLAGDLVALMDALGHQRFAVVGHDTGFAISYALAADHPDRVERVALAELPGSPGAAPYPPVLVPGPLNDRLWHLGFNRI